jgi:phosphatidylserine decarboxylase
LRIEITCFAPAFEAQQTMAVAPDLVHKVRFIAKEQLLSSRDIPGRIACNLLSSNRVRQFCIRNTRVVYARMEEKATMYQFLAGFTIPNRKRVLCERRFHSGKRRCGVVAYTQELPFLRRIEMLECAAYIAFCDKLVGLSNHEEWFFFEDGAAS